MVTDGSAADGRSVSSSDAMSQETAEWYVEQTNGQLVAFLHLDGNWYLYAPEPVAPSEGSVSAVS